MYWSRMIRPILAVFGSVALVAAMLLLPRQAQSPASAQAPNDDSVRRFISASGTGSTIVQPDLAYITLGVHTEAETARQALNQNSQQMQSVTRALQAAGIAAADIQTFTIQIYPRYDDPFARDMPTAPDQQRDLTPQVRGYTAVNTVQVTVRNINNLGDIIDRVVDAGGNRVENIRFDVANQAQALTQARAAAFENARQKANQLAGLADAELGQVISISESSYFPMAFRESAMDMAAGSSVPISPGTQAVTIDLTVTWEMQ
jgi:uncharacterized protein